MVNGDSAGMKTSIEIPRSRFEDGVETRKVPQGRLYTGRGCLRSMIGWRGSPADRSHSCDLREEKS
jgi:hypothetical protein